jgi:hypothetical protein
MCVLEARREILWNIPSEGGQDTANSGFAPLWASRKTGTTYWGVKERNFGLYVCLFYGLFKDAVSSPDYTELSNWIVNVNEFERKQS